jgi:protein TonB
MMVQIRMPALIRQPWMMSCLLHGVVILGACALFGEVDFQVQEKPPAEVVMEVAAEDLPERNVPQNVSLNPLAKESVWEKLMAPAQEQVQPEPMTPAGTEGAGGEAAPAGSAAVLDATEAADGDGVTAAGSGSTAAAGGRAASGGDNGNYESAAADSTAQAAEPAPAPVSTAPAESTASVASRFAARVEANKEYPYMAVKRGQSGVVSVTVTLSAEGVLESSYISASSGVSVLDNAALQAVRNSCPFGHGAGRSLTLTVPIHFDLQ